MSVVDRQPSPRPSIAWGGSQAILSSVSDSGIIVGQPPHHLYIYDTGYDIREDETSQDPWSFSKAAEEEELAAPVEPPEPSWEGTYQAAAAEYIFVSPEQQLSSDENVTLFNEGLVVVDKMIDKKPFKERLQVFNRVVAHLLFFANLIVSMVDIILGPVHLHYKVTCFAFSVFENVALIGLWLIKRMVLADQEALEKKYGWFGKTWAKIKNFMIKYTQHFENIIHELLLYPLIIFTIVGVATEKSYRFAEQDHLTSAAMILVFLDVLDLLYTYIIRMFMVQKLIGDLKRDVPSIRRIRLGKLRVVNFFYWNLLCNTLTFSVMLAMLYLQVFHENNESENYNVHLNAGFMIAFCLIVPIFNICMFVLVNYFVFLELLIKINLRYVKKENFRNKMDTYKEEYGTAVATLLETARTKIVSTQERLNLIQRMPVRKKLLYSLSEWWVVILMLIWCLVYTLFFAFFTVDAHAGYGSYVQYVYIGILVVGNPQLFMLVEVLDMFMISYIFMGLYGFMKSFLKFVDSAKAANTQQRQMKFCEMCFDSFCKDTCYCFGIMDDDKNQQKLHCCCAKKEEVEAEVMKLTEAKKKNKKEKKSAVDNENDIQQIDNESEGSVSEEESDDEIKEKQ